MDIKSLMVGDWVFIKDYPIKALPQKVKPEHFVRSLIEFEPIPLQRIHLAKNGFKADEKDEIFTYYEGYKVTVDFDDIFGGNAYLRIDFADKHLDIEIEYVHELQQAMRIMGCDKEIEL